MDWKPFLVCADDERPPQPRGLRTPEGLGDRLRTAAFAERQARDAFRWARERFPEAGKDLLESWGRFAAEEEKHMGWLLARMAELGVDAAARPVSGHLWRSLTACKSAAEFGAVMAEAEERGRTAEKSFEQSLASFDPETSRIFGRIAAEEEEHIAAQRGIID